MQHLTWSPPTQCLPVSQSLTYKRFTLSFVDIGRCISSGLRGGGYCLIAWNVSRPDGTEDGVTRQLDSLSM